jgi:heme/copper-type cytochrome/quinol oxidase subunit 3
MSDSNSAPTSGDKYPFEGLDPVVRERTKKMMMYFILFAVIMLFSGFTSAYIVSNSGQFWVDVNPGSWFWISNALIVASSVMMWMSVKSLKSGMASTSSIYLGLVFVLGMGFAGAQLKGWGELQEHGMGWSIDMQEDGLRAFRWNDLGTVLESDGVYGEDYLIKRNGKALQFDAASEKLYDADDLLRAQDLSRVVARMTNSSSAYILVMVMMHLLHLMLGLGYVGVNAWRVVSGKVHQDDTLKLRICGIYWHFLGALWLYLFAFLFLIF